MPHLSAKVLARDARIFLSSNLLGRNGIPRRAIAFAVHGVFRPRLPILCGGNTVNRVGAKAGGSHF